MPKNGLVEDAVLDGCVADIALPFHPVCRRRNAAAVDVFARIDAPHLGPEVAPKADLAGWHRAERAMELVLVDRCAGRAGAAKDRFAIK